MTEGYGGVLAGYGMRCSGYEVWTAEVLVEVWRDGCMSWFGSKKQGVGRASPTGSTDANKGGLNLDP